MIKLVEVCEAAKISSMQKQQSYTLREIYVNPEYVISFREDTTVKQKLLEGELPEGLDERQVFTKLYLDKGQVGSEIVVVGHPQAVEEKLFGNQKQLLRG